MRGVCRSAATGCCCGAEGAAAGAAAVLRALLRAGRECRVSAGCEQRPERTRASRASPTVARRAPRRRQLRLASGSLACRPSGWIGYLRAVAVVEVVVEEGHTYVPRPAGGIRDRPQRGAACVRGMCARHVGTRPTVSLAPSERERVGAALARRLLACARTLRVVRVAARRRVRPTALGVARLEGGLGRRGCGAEEAEAEDAALRGLGRGLRRGRRRAAMGRRLRGRPLVPWARAWEGVRAARAARAGEGGA